MLFASLIIAILLVSPLAIADEKDYVLPGHVTDALHNNPYMQGDYKSKLQSSINSARQKASELSGTINKRFVERTGVSPMMRAYGIADEAMANEREKILNQLGLSYKDPKIYIFVSFSMPIDVIRAYAQEAMWTGGILVVKGMSEEDTLKTFVNDKLLKIVGTKGASSTIQIDPRLFDAFKITSVPTIVYTQLESLSICSSVTKSSGTINKDQYTYDACSEVPESEYWKLSGSVTLDWALEQFVDANAPGAEKHLSVLRETLKHPSVKSQRTSIGNWDDIPSPAMLQKVKTLLQEYGVVYETPLGIGVGPEGMEDAAAGIHKVR